MKKRFRAESCPETKKRSRIAGATRERSVLTDGFGRRSRLLRSAAVVNRGSDGLVLSFS
jgi:hypothetical protein